jgi:tetratricopeptide (TPR) repeat protein
LRLAEKGRQYLLQKQHRQAVTYLEKALGLEASPYVYYYLSRAHYYLGHYGESANFLDVAAALLAPRLEWTTAVAAVRAQYAERASNDDKERPVARVRAVRPTGMPERSGM